MKLRAFLVAAALAVVAAPVPLRADTPAASPGHVAEPAGLYKGNVHGYVPGTLQGGTVLDTAALLKLVDGTHPVLIDVADKERKPPTMAPGMIWAPQHRTIPGAVWLQGAGNATDDAAFAAAFRTRLAALTGGKPATTVVVFCHPDCWASYNAAKRAVGLGYTQVYWYPQGMEGWQSERDTGVIKPDAAWLASLPKAPTQ